MSKSVAFSDLPRGAPFSLYPADGVGWVRTIFTKHFYGEVSNATIRFSDGSVAGIVLGESVRVYLRSDLRDVYPFDDHVAD